MAEARPAQGLRSSWGQSARKKNDAMRVFGRASKHVFGMFSGEPQKFLQTKKFSTLSAFCIFHFVVTFIVFAVTKTGQRGELINTISSVNKCS